MTIDQSLLQWLGLNSQHAVAILAIFGLFGVLGTFLATVWALVKVGYQQIWGKPFPKTPLTNKIDLVLYILVNIPGMVNKMRKDSGATPLFLKEGTSEPSTPPPSV